MSIAAAIPILGGRVLRAAESDRSATLRPKKEPEKAVPLSSAAIPPPAWRRRATMIIVVAGERTGRRSGGGNDVHMRI